MDSTNRKPIPFTMKRDISFPHQMRRFTKSRKKVWEHSMQPHPVPTDGLHLELQLGDLLGYGSSGHVYAVRVIRMSNNEGEDSTNSDIQLPEMCIKLAEPNRVRGLAREAWFYEQLRLEGLEGVVSPRFYSFFTSSCDHDRVVPWRKRDWIFRTQEPDLFESEDGLMLQEYIMNEPKDWSRRRFDDELGSHQNSKWLEFRQSCSTPLVSILLLERLGETLKEDYKTEESSYLDDAEEVLDDVIKKGFFHGDIRYNQFAVAPNPIPCPRHMHAHKVFMLDFGLVDRVPPFKRDREFARLQQDTWRNTNKELGRVY
ncbi:hypothetical protein QCA50_016544 [Cerrena zonata]|uniref:Protein kinase domain-containing protein n=1 Tax=Cerrena zonata TaxID=2478898 RepID=A0AAW0FQ09_9APHY